MNVFSLLWPLGPALVLGLAGLAWIASLWRHDASLADRFWPLFVAALPIAVWALGPVSGARGQWMFALMAAWALRLGLFITWRNWGHGEDRRYARMRERHGPAFALRSLYIVFGLQAVLACIVALPVLGGLASTRPLGLLDGIGAGLAIFGLVFEAVADAQLARFLREPATQGRVMDRGLWAWTRHPNYFGEACVWWGLGMMAWAGGAPWGLLSPLMMTGLLLKVSGVSLLEQDIGDRRPGYRDYVERTPAFWPRPPRGTGHP